MQERLADLRWYVRGWVDYFGMATLEWLNRPRNSLGHGSDLERSSAALNAAAKLGLVIWRFC
ncbi:MAG: hypothetical protein ACI814_001877 [Mariniblastus sp.]|jgi:hypothetical protein